MQYTLSSILEDINAGKPIILVDSMDRENEGDLMIAAERATVENIAFMCRYGRGIMCLPTTGEVLDRLQIPMMVENSTDPYHTAFTVSVDAIEGVTTGVSAADRLTTMKIMTNPNSVPSDLARPGHLFPLRARDGLLNDRQGHTESSVTLVKMLGLSPVAVISEIMNENGTMSRMDDLMVLANEHKLKIFSIDELRKHVV